MCSVSECHNEASLIQRTRSTRGCFTMEKYTVICWVQKEVCHAEILLILVVCKIDTLPAGTNRYPFYRRLGEQQSLSGRAENLVSTGFDPDRPARSQSLYRQSSRIHNIKYWSKIEDNIVATYCRLATACHVISKAKINFCIKYKIHYKGC